MLSTIILTQNSQNTIEDCLNSVLFSDEILIIDDFSTDQTLEKIKAFSSRIKSTSTLEKSKDFININKRHLNNDFSSQRNFGLNQAKGDWILFLDSDEIISPILKIEIIESIKSQNFDGYYLKRQDIFLGKKLKYGETGNTKFIRLAKKGFGKWLGKVHEIWNIDKSKVGILNSPISHNHNITVSRFIEKIDNYSTIKSQELFENKIREPIIYIFIYPFAKFIQNYFIKLGFLDGFQGFIIAYLMSFHSLLVRLKLQLLYLNKIN